MQRIAAIIAFALLAAACGGADTAPTSTVPPTVAPLAISPRAPDGTLVACSPASPASAPDDWYRDTPVYVGNEQPVEAVAAWAATRPGYQSIWVDREHNGWITVAFTSDAVDRQRELLDEFPGVGVVAIQVGWSVANLRTLQDQVVAHLSGLLDSFGVATLETKGIVEISVGRLSDEQRTEIIDRWAGQPVCLAEPDPATLPEPGPQPTQGAGWTLLASEKGVGRSYHTAIATDAASLAAMWAEIGFESTIPIVDFEKNVVIWFGAVFGSGCDDLRLDDVVVDGTIVYADIVIADAPVACAGDANPFAFVVTLEREQLPVGPFSIQLDADGPPGGVPEERTNVNADLTIPGSTVSPEQITQGLVERPPNFIQSGEILEPGFPRQFQMYVHCGINWIGEFNDILWLTPEEMPDEWRALVTDNETLIVSIKLTEGPPPTLRAVANGVAVIYEPTTEPPPPCD